MSNKVGIVNFQFSKNNYGAVLQAAAIEYAIRQLGYDVQHINFIPEPGNPKVVKFKRAILSMLNFFTKKDTSVKALGESVFESFRDDYLSRTLKTYKNGAELSQISDDYAYIVVGSDQVWRPEYTNGCPLSFFLNFADEKCKRVSYAASFGHDKWTAQDDHDLTAKVKKELKRYKSISVRESSGVEICKDIFNVHSEHVLDPTLLVGEGYFSEVIESYNHIDRSEKLVYYKLDHSGVFVEQLKVIAHRTSLTIENIYHKKVDGELYFNGVEEWLWKIKNSELVITDSFHCVCFSILFRKKFIYASNESRGMSRLESLLGLLGLENRVCLDDSELSNKRYDENIDYRIVDMKLRELRESSLSFLKKALDY
jgi:hypothetical protein